MRQFLSVTLLLLFATAPFVVSAQSSPSSVGVGPNGYGFLIGRWGCNNTMPSTIGGPPVLTQTFTQSGSSPAGVFARVTGRGFDASGYVAYDAKTQTWWSPTSLGNGAVSLESTRQTGAKTVWNGNALDASGSTKIRDTYVVAKNMREYTDTTQLQTGGAWKTVAKLTCRKSS